MKFRKVSEEEFQGYDVKGRMSPMSFIEEFINSDLKVGELLGWKEHWSSIYSARSCFQKVIKRNAPPVRVAIRRDHLFLCRTDMGVK